MNITMMVGAVAVESKKVNESASVRASLLTHAPRVPSGRGHVADTLKPTDSHVMSSSLSCGGSSGTSAEPRVPLPVSVSFAFPVPSGDGGSPSPSPPPPLPSVVG